MVAIRVWIKGLSWKHRLFILAILVFWGWFWLALPSRLFTAPTSYVLTDNEGGLLSASIAGDGQWRFPYDDQVPEKFIQCITAFEDKRFFYHPGVDPLAVLRSIRQHITHSKTVSGGSTLTMQVIRLSEKNNKRTLFNKIKESILALRLECSYSKRSILALYASNAPFGSNVVGLDAAAWRYFNRSAQQLSWGEMAALAVLPNAPSLVHPGKNRSVLLKKRDLLLDKLVLAKVISQNTCDLAKLEPLPGEPKILPQLAPHLLNRFRKEFPNLQAQDHPSSTAVATTIDGTLQNKVHSILLEHHEILKGNAIKNAAALVVEIETGNILSYIGNVFDVNDSTSEKDVDVLAARRSPGSTLKPLLYASLLTEGTLLPNQLVPDVPTQIGGYVPQNFDLGYDGAVHADKALSRSLNIPAVKMLQQFKYQKFYDVLNRCGLTTLTQSSDFYGMSIILGGCEVNPVELAGVYSSMARMYLHQKKNKGNWNTADWFMPRYIKGGVNHLKDSEANKRKQPLDPDENALFDFTAIWQTFQAMNEVMRPGEEGLWDQFNSSQKIAWKTGTSFGFRDGWAIGITPRYCVLVWVGNTTGEGRPALTGISTAAPILFDIFRALPVSEWFSPPTDGFIYLPVCRNSGFRASADCEEKDTIMVNQSAKNAATCPYCRKINMDPTGKYRVSENCELPYNMKQVSWFILPPTLEYYYKQKHPGYKELPPWKPGCQESDYKLLDIIYPEENASIYVPLEITGEKGKTIFRATHKNAAAKLFWHIDDQYIATTERFHQIAVDPAAGKHVLTVIDEAGNSIVRKFEVIAKKKK